MESKYFWENDNPRLPIEKSVWGEKSKIFDKILMHFPDNANILEIGCGDGRNTIFLSQFNPTFKITAIEKSKKSILRLENRIKHFNLNNINLILGDFQNTKIDGVFDIILVQGILHFIEKNQYNAFFKKVFELTASHGFNFVSDFTNLLPFPKDIKEIFISHLEPKELLEIYKQKEWDIMLYEHYQTTDTHMNNTIHHTHDITCILSKKLP